jgi:2,5-diamino-6-(ribosylamino)-4(3H)-pyrimidinone 5'-phosphate reductase
LPQLPHVVVHAAVSLDGATGGFEPDVERFYELAREFEEDVTLTGADTILAQSRALATAPRPGPDADAPLLAVVDGRRRVRDWEALRDCGHWSDVIALRAAASPNAPDAGVQELVAGVWQVDLALALADLAGDHGASVVRVDSGGTLTGALLAAGLVDEVSLLVHPRLVADHSQRRWHGPRPVPSRRLALFAAEPLDRGLVWLRYRLEPGVQAATAVAGSTRNTRWVPERPLSSSSRPSSKL